MRIKTKEYQESREFNPVLWTLRKKLFALRRYIVNIILLLIGAGVYFWFTISTTVP